VTRGLPQDFREPVDLPEGVSHCTPTAYGTYKCRCRYCVTWRRMYDQIRHHRDKEERQTRKRDCRDYLAHRGIHVYGSGPFRNRPERLARIVADALGDDLEAWLRKRWIPS
jgi:hypothetical protein